MTQTEPSFAQSRGLTPRARLAIWAAAAALLAFPAIAMQFTAGVNWDLGDFLIFGGMLLVLCGAIETSMKFPAERKWRLAAVAVSLFIFLMVWAELAVGIFD